MARRPRISVPGRRSVLEWIAKTPDQRVPDYVRLRVFERYDGICQISWRKIQVGEAWELEHETPLRDGGEHRESNLRPALTGPHKQKTAEEARERAKGTRKRKRHLGIKPRKRPLPGSKASGWKQKVSGEWVRR